MNTETPVTQWVNSTALKPSPTNPRKQFDETKLRQLGDTFKTEGFLQDLLVRPLPGAAGQFQIVDGERRWRAAQLVGVESLPIRVRELTDAQVIAHQLVAGENSEPLAPLEEGAGFRTALDMKDTDGKPCYTLRSLAAKLGCSHVHIQGRTSLLELPADARTALSGGTLAPRTANLIARIPTAEDRVLATTDILKPQHRTEPLTYREAEELIHERYMVSLRSAPFMLDDEKLAGPESTPLACLKCPFKTGNDPERFGDMKDKNVCTNPACYRNKCNAVWDRAAKAAKAKGRQVLADDEAAKVFDADALDPEVRPDSPYIDLNTKPTYRHVPNVVEDSKLPTWRELIAGAEEKGIVVPIVEARHVRSGRRVELVKLEHAIEAAKKNGEDIFRKDNVGSVVRSTDDFAEKKKAEQEAAKKRLVESSVAIVALHEKLQGRKLFMGDVDVTRALLPIALHHAGTDGQALFVKAFELATAGDEFELTDAIEGWFKKQSGYKQAAAIAVLLIAHDMKWNGLKSEGFAELAAAVKLDVKKIETEAAARLAASKPGKKPAAVKPPKVTEHPTTLAQWVKAAAAGMSPAAIAQSWKVPLADVEGALSAARTPQPKRDAGKVAVAAVQASLKKPAPKAVKKTLAKKPAKKARAGK